MKRRLWIVLAVFSLFLTVGESCEEPGLPLPQASAPAVTSPPSSNSPAPLTPPPSSVPHPVPTPAPTASLPPPTAPPLPPPSTEPPRPSELDRVKVSPLDSGNSCVSYWSDQLDDNANLLSGYQSIFSEWLSVGAYDGGWYQGFVTADLSALPAASSRVEMRFLGVQAQSPSELWAARVGSGGRNDIRIIPPSQIGDWITVDLTSWLDEWEKRGEMKTAQFTLRSNLPVANVNQESWNRFYSNSSINRAYYRPRLVVTTGAIPGRFIFPLEGRYYPDRVSGYRFGDWWEYSYCQKSGYLLKHTGVDLHATVGEAVRAVKPGKVVYARTDSTWGGYLVLEHEEAYTTSYLHVWPSVSLGDNVIAGQKIAEIAPLTGYGSHLHFQVRSARYEHPRSIRGRLPEVDCVTIAGESADPAWPEKFIDPEYLDWE